MPAAGSVISAKNYVPKNGDILEDVEQFQWECVRGHEYNDEATKHRFRYALFMMRPPEGMDRPIYRLLTTDDSPRVPADTTTIIRDGRRYEKNPRTGNFQF